VSFFIVEGTTAFSPQTGLGSPPLRSVDYCCISVIFLSHFVRTIIAVYLSIFLSHYVRTIIADYCNFRIRKRPQKDREIGLFCFFSFFICVCAIFVVTLQPNYKLGLV